VQNRSALLEKTTVLVIEDSSTLRNLMELVLVEAGLRVISAADGASALEAARTDTPGLVVLDDVLPDMGVLEICSALRKLPSLGDLPILLLRSGSAPDDPSSRAVGVVDAISKPFKPETLLTVVSHILAPGRTSDALAAVERPLALTPIEGVATARFEMPDLGTAALAGDLGAIPVSDVLAMVQDRQQSGTLTVARETARVQFFVRNGALDFANAIGVPEEFLLGRYLVEQGFVTQSDLEAVVANERQNQKRKLGEALVSRGLLDATKLKEAIRLQTQALVYEVTRWTAGRFALDCRAAWPEEAQTARLGLNVDHLLMEGLRRIDEWRVIEREINDFDAVFVREEDRFAALGRGKLLRDEMAIARLVTGKHSVKEIVAESRMGSFDVSRILFRLLRNKLIRKRVTPTTR
jgi:CheY-like chemotaxis protein